MDTRAREEEDHPKKTVAALSSCTMQTQPSPRGATALEALKKETTPCRWALVKGMTGRNGNLRRRI